MAKRSKLCDISNEEFQELLNRNTMTEIGKEFGISRERVRQLRVKRGLNRGATSKWRLTKEEFETLLEECDMNMAEVAREIGVSQNVVYYHARQYGLCHTKTPHHITGWVTTEQYAHILDIGKGSISTGIRRIIREHRKRNAIQEPTQPVSY